MTSEKLYGILKFLEALDKKLTIQVTLEGVQTALTNLVNQPAQPQYQRELASALAAFEKAAAQLSGSITPSQYELIKGMGGEKFFDPLIADKVRESVQKNAATLSVAQAFVKTLVDERSEFLDTVRSARQSLEALGIAESPLAPGSADLAFLIPRNIFDNKLAKFAKELTYINRLLEHFSEALTNESQPIELEQLSSSVPTIALLASVPVILALANIIDKFLSAWKKIEEIRQMRAKLIQMGLKKKTAIDELTEEVETTIDEVVEEATVLVLVNYKGSPERRNELSTAIRQDTHRLFGQIERGLTVEFRTQSKKDGTPEEAKALTDIADLSRTMQFPQVAPEPMLLKGGEIIDGEIQTVKQATKTTTRRKTTTSKKGQPKDGGDAEQKE